MDEIIDMWSLLDSILGKYGIRIRGKLSDLNITVSEYKIMYLIHDNIRPMKYISDKLSLAKGWVTDIIDALENKGMVERVRSSEDRRIINIKITEEGNKKYIEIQSIIKNIIKSSIAGLDSEEIVSVIRILNKIDKSMD